MSNNQQHSSADKSYLQPSFKAESDRTQWRRSALGIDRNKPWALALSGGGIRSATFCLGVLQAFAKSPPPQSFSPPKPSDPVAPDKARNSLLPQFDYVSTVSGGGYIGSFFCSLFVAGRLNKGSECDEGQANRLDELATANEAYDVFDKEPPGRLHSSDSFKANDPGALPLAWLRENGRYIAPTGTGDVVYAAAMAVRNWFAMHYVLGTVLFTAFALPALVRAALALSSERYRDYEIWLLHKVVVECSVIWWSPIWWVAATVLILWVVPSGLSYWLSNPAKTKTRNQNDGPRVGALAQKPLPWSLAAVFATVLGIVSLMLAFLGSNFLKDDWARVLHALAGIGSITLLSCLMYTITAWFSPTISSQRVTLTRYLTNGFLSLAGIALIALVDTTTQSLYAFLYGDPLTVWLTPAAAAGAIVWLVRTLASRSSEKASTGWLGKIPLNMVAMIGGSTLFLLVALLWSLLVLWIHWHGARPDVAVLVAHDRQSETVIVLLATTLFGLALALITGQFPGFLNLSTLQGLYSARLTRAYFGASNGERFAKATASASSNYTSASTGNDGNAKSDAQVKAALIKLRSVAEPIASDHITPQEYYLNSLAPLHIINVCVNQTVDPAEQLVQRDRKGKPLAILPGGYALDGEFRSFLKPAGKSELDVELTMGEWVGVSGAAVSTALGRNTSAGYSLLMGLANLRLGRWWESGVTRPSVSGVRKFVRALFKTQAYLFNELFATYYGTRRQLQYLTDGGHFENTGVYELLRKERAIRLIVACDCGCDPTYQFENLANLVRLARIDFGIEIEVDRSIVSDPLLCDVFGVPEDFAIGTDGLCPVNGKCALLLNIFYSRMAQAANQPDARIVLLKPRLVAGMAIDLMQYQAIRPQFPQESTADQFYDEAQWESYRKLGFEIANRVFGQADVHKGRHQALWARLLA